VTIHLPPDLSQYAIEGPPAGPPDGTPYIGYVRVSTWREEAISPEIQAEAITSWANRNGHRIIGWITDLDATGRNFKRRIMQGITAIEEGAAAGIAVWKFSRFGRDRAGVALNLARVERVGGVLQSATEAVDARTATGRFTRGMLLEVAAFESDRAGEQWRETHALRRQHGIPATGGQRLGYIWHRRRIPDPARPGKWILQPEWYEPDPETAPIVAALYTDQLDHRTGYAALVARLNAAGLRNGWGRLWKFDGLRRYMRTGFPAGLLRIHDPECHCDYKANGGTCTRWTYIEGRHEALITPETWERWLDLRAEIRGTAPRARNPIYPTTGLARCGNCRGGANATSARRKGGQVPGYALSCGQGHSTGRTVCDSPVWVQRAIVEDELRIWLAREAAAGIDATPATTIPAQRRVPEEQLRRAAAERGKLVAEVERAGQALTRLAVEHAMHPDAMPPEVYEAAQREIMQRRDQARQALASLGETPAEVVRLDVRPVMLGLLDAWEIMTAEEKNRLLRELVRRVVLTRGAAGQKGVEGSGQTRIEIHPVWEPDPWAE